MQAYSNLEPWGALQDDFRAGQICATLANINRDPKTQREAWAARDFFPSLARVLDGLARPSQALLLDDADAQTALIKRAVFGVAAA